LVVISCIGDRFGGCSHASLMLLKIRASQNQKYICTIVQSFSEYLLTLPCCPHVLCEFKFVSFVNVGVIRWITVNEKMVNFRGETQLLITVGGRLRKGRIPMRCA